METLFFLSLWAHSTWNFTTFGSFGLLRVLISVLFSQSCSFYKSFLCQVRYSQQTPLQIRLAIVVALIVIFAFLNFRVLVRNRIYGDKEDLKNNLHKDFFENRLIVSLEVHLFVSVLREDMLIADFARW